MDRDQRPTPRVLRKVEAFHSVRAVELAATAARCGWCRYVTSSSSVKSDQTHIRRASNAKDDMQALLDGRLALVTVRGCPQQETDELTAGTTPASLLSLNSLNIGIMGTAGATKSNCVRRMKSTVCCGSGALLPDRSVKPVSSSAVALIPHHHSVKNSLIRGTATPSTCGEQQQVLVQGLEVKIKGQPAGAFLRSRSEPIGGSLGRSGLQNGILAAQQSSQKRMRVQEPHHGPQSALRRGPLSSRLSPLLPVPLRALSMPGSADDDAAKTGALALHRAAEGTWFKRTPPVMTNSLSMLTRITHFSASGVEVPRHHLRASSAAGLHGSPGCIQSGKAHPSVIAPFPRMGSSADLYYGLLISSMIKLIVFWLL